MAAIREGEDEDMGVSLKYLSKKLEDFAKARDWEKYHTPRNLLLAMVGEVGDGCKPFFDLPLPLKFHGNRASALCRFLLLLSSAKDVIQFFSAMADKSDTNPPKAIHPVYTVTNIQHKVRTLDGTKVTYSSWVRLFKLHARGYKVLGHIDGSTDTPAVTDPAYEAWSEIDAIVLQWIFGTLSDDILPRVLDQTTALGAWNKVKEIFLNNKASHAAALKHEFNNLTLRAMTSLEAYCQRLKDLASQLEDVKCPVTPNRLVLQLVRGLPAEFDTTAALINKQLPTWDTACSMLQLEQQRQRARDTHSPCEVAATVDHDPPTSPPPPPRRDQTAHRSHQPQQRNSNRHSSPSGSQQQNRTTNQQSGRSTNTSQNNRRGPPSAQQRPPWSAYPPPYWPAPWWASPPPCPYPTQGGWAAPCTVSPSGPPSQSNRQAEANLAEVNPLDAAQLETTFSAMNIDPNDDQWYMDTGATSHLTADAGFQEWEASDKAQ